MNIEEIKVNELLGDPEATPVPTNWIRARLSGNPHIQHAADRIANQKSGNVPVAAFQSAI